MMHASFVDSRLTIFEIFSRFNREFARIEGKRNETVTLELNRLRLAAMLLAFVNDLSVSYAGVGNYNT